MPPKASKSEPIQVEMSEFEDEIDVLDPSVDDPFGLGRGNQFSLDDDQSDDDGKIVIVDEDDDEPVSAESEEDPDEDDEDDEDDEGEDDEDEEGLIQAAPPQHQDVYQSPEYQELLRQNRTAQYQGMAAAVALAKKEAEEARRELINAKEDGDSEKEVEAQERMFRANSIIQQATPHLEQMRRELETGAPQQQAPQRQAVPELQGAAGQWVKNQDFFQKNDDASLAVRAVVVSIDNALAIERTDVGSKEYMDELTRRINASVGRPVAKFTSGRKQATGKRVRNNGTSKVAGGTSGGVAKKKTGKGAGVSYTQAELQELQKFGIDPRNPKHLGIMQRERELRQKREAKGDMIDV